MALLPRRKTPLPDAFEARLKQLALLRQPDSTLPHADNGASDASANEGDEAGVSNAYRVRDFLKAQVERRWSLDLASAQRGIVRIRVQLAADGSVTKAEILDRARYATDAGWRALALSGRNAVLLSSPLALPAGMVRKPLDVVLALNPKDAMR